MKGIVIAELCEVAADLIGDHPQAAAVLARRLGNVLRAEEARENDHREQRAERERHRGIDPDRGW